ncbi:MAG: hypothetical protein IJY65_00470 [Clostridia bacterium]|nr:hypothetical protein [Clostridia bacterium]
MKIGNWRADERRASFLQRSAHEVKQYSVRMKIGASVLACLVLMVGMLYLVATLYKQTGSFTVSIDKVEMMKYGLTLSETKDMLYNSSHLNTHINESITNMAEEDLPQNLDNIDGAHHGKDYIAYTFYLQNAGETSISYEYSVIMSNVTNGLDEAIRLRLYKDGEYETYAKTAVDGSGAEIGTTEFYSGNIMAHGRVDNFDPDEVTKFTVVIWIEGSDPDCIDWLIGGEIKLEMVMEVVH